MANDANKITVYTLLTAGDATEPIDETYEAWLNRSLTPEGEERIRKLRKRRREPLFDAAIASNTFCDLRTAEIFAGMEHDNNAMVMPMTLLTFENPKSSEEAAHLHKISLALAPLSLSEFKKHAGPQAFLALRNRTIQVLHDVQSLAPDAEEILFVGHPLILLAIAYDAVYPDEKERRTLFEAELGEANGYVVGFSTNGPRFMERLAP